MWRLALSVVVTSRPDEVRSARRVVFPGQGAMPDCMRELDARGLRPAVLEAARSKPFLGICIGLQMLFEVSEEGDVPGLDLVEGRVVRFPAHGMVGAAGERLKVPHMGWNEVHQTRGASPVARHRPGRAVLLRAQLLSGAAQPRADCRLQRVSGPLHLRGCQG